MFRCLHDDPRLAKVVEVAVGTPNQLSLPIMVMLSMCKSSVVNADFENDGDICGEVAMSYLFIYAMGFYVSFWGYGYGQLASLKKPRESNNNNTAPTVKTSKLMVAAVFLKKAIFNHMLICVYFGVLIACFPFAQDILYGDSGMLRPLGDAIRTIGEPTVAVNCIIMSGSLALTFSSSRAQKNKDEDGDDIELSIISNKGEATSDRSKDVKVKSVNI